MRAGVGLEELLGGDKSFKGIVVARAVVAELGQLIPGLGADMRGTSGIGGDGSQGGLGLIGFAGSMVEDGALEECFGVGGIAGQGVVHYRAGVVEAVRTLVDPGQLA